MSVSTDALSIIFKQPSRIKKGREGPLGVTHDPIETH
jgi:hypothetical protein